MQKRLKTKRPPKKNKNEERRKKRGRTTPYVLTPQFIKTVANAVRAGSYAEMGAVAAGISKATFYAWLKRGNEAIQREDESREEKPYIDFVNAINRAFAQGHELKMAQANAFVEAGDAQTLRWMMSKRYKEQWGEEKQHIHSHAHNHKHQGEVAQKEAFKLDLQKLPVEMLKQLWEEMQKQKQLAPKQVTMEGQRNGAQDESRLADSPGE